MRRIIPESIFLAALLCGPAALAAGPAAAERAARKAFQAGDSAKAATLLVQAADAFQAARRTRDEMRVLEALVNIYARSGEADKQIAALAREVEIANGKADRKGAAALYTAIGDAYGCLDGPAVCAAAERRTSAVDAYRKSAAVSIAAADRTVAIAALLKAAAVARTGGGTVEPAALLDQAEEVSASIQDPASRFHQQTAVGHARLLAGDAGRGMAILRKVVDAADAANLPWAAADAEGLLGWAAAEAHDSDAAVEHTRLALRRAGERGNPGDLFPWEWQLGRLYRAAGNRKEAAREYELAAAMAERTAVTTSPAAKAPGTFAAAGDIFLDYAGFLTELARTETGAERQKLLRDARDALLSRRRRQLSEYYGGDCFQRSGAGSASSTELDAASPKTLVLYPMFLPGRVEILTSKDGTLDTVAVNASPAEVESQIEKLRYYLEKRTTLEYRAPAQTLYDHLIRPLEKQVVLQDLDALVMIPDGPLHRIPIAALHNGEKFLIELVPVATAPGFKLSGTPPLRLMAGGMAGAVLAAGLSKGKPGNPGFAPLPHVEDELKAAEGHFHYRSELLDAKFDPDRLTSLYRRHTYSVVHIASHAQFSRTAAASAIITSRRDLNVAELDFFLQGGDSGAVLDLLVLSACDTAEGDDRAGLGLGGVAIEAGARSAIATLWHINDDATSVLLREFYSKLYTGSKAKALQFAQTQLLKDPWFRHPGYWAPFLLINDWR